jgi:rubredoxin
MGTTDYWKKRDNRKTWSTKYFVFRRHLSLWYQNTCAMCFVFSLKGNNANYLKAIDPFFQLSQTVICPQLGGGRSEVDSRQWIVQLQNFLDIYVWKKCTVSVGDCRLFCCWVVFSAELSKFIIIIIIIIIINSNLVSTRWQCSICKYKKHKHYIRRRRRKTIKQTYNTITRNRKNKKQPYRTKNKHKISNTNLQDNKITHWTMKQHA